MKDLCWEKKIDEASLTYEDRLGLAWCRLNHGKWDPLLGQKPDYWDSLPERKPWWRFWDKQPARWQEAIKVMRAIEGIIGAANANRCWWKFVLGRTEDEWIHWYVRKNLEN